MLHSLFIRIVERIPTIKDLRKRLKRSVEFSADCGFSGSDRIPSEASYTRLIQKLQKSQVFQQSQEQLVHQAFQEGFIDASVIAVDATHVEARDRGPNKTNQDGWSDESSNPSNGDGETGVGFQYQDEARVEAISGSTVYYSYLGRGFAATLTYNSDFSDFNGKARTAYAHTWDDVYISSVSYNVSSSPGFSVGFANGPEGWAISNGSDTLF